MGSQSPPGLVLRHGQEGGPHLAWTTDDASVALLCCVASSRLPSPDAAGSSFCPRRQDKARRGGESRTAGPLPHHGPAKATSPEAAIWLVIRRRPAHLGAVKLRKFGDQLGDQLGLKLWRAARTSLCGTLALVPRCSKRLPEAAALGHQAPRCSSS